MEVVMTAHLTVDGGTLAYEVTGTSGPLVVLAHGIGDSREAYRFVVPALAQAGYRVAAVDLRGCGQSSTGWASYTQSDIAGDLIALIEHLGGPAVLVGHSISGGAATIAAATAPSLVIAVVELGSFTRKQQLALSDLRVQSFRRCARHLLGVGLFGSIASWKKYLNLAYPGTRPADWDARLDQIEVMLREPGRKKVLKRMSTGGAAEAGACLGAVACPVLVVQGTLDPDWASPQAEGEAIVAALPPGLGRLEMLPGAGHYPHTQCPAQVVTVLLSLPESVRA